LKFFEIKESLGDFSLVLSFRKGGYQFSTSKAIFQANFAFSMTSLLATPKRFSNLNFLKTVKG
jgi:hypothetical protein